jgi:hypothetical protein
MYNIIFSGYHPRQVVKWRKNQSFEDHLQPTKKLTKGGILRKRETSSLARFDHSCALNTLLEMVKVALKL